MFDRSGLGVQFSLLRVDLFDLGGKRCLAFLKTNGQVVEPVAFFPRLDGIGLW